MAGTKIRTFLELIKKGESIEAAIAASGVSSSTAKIQLRKNSLTEKVAGPKKPAKAKKAKVVEEDEEEIEEDSESEEDDLDDIA